MKFKYSKVLIVTDNNVLCKAFFDVCKTQNIPMELFNVGYSPKNSNFKPDIPKKIHYSEINIKNSWKTLKSNYDLIFSMHCKQLFPAELVNSVKCINLHPGLNPFNRGWYPQVFSIINKLPLGATLHEMDEQVDHGPIIAQKEVTLNASDTSLTAYEKIQQAEIEILKKYLIVILTKNYSSRKMQNEGNINLKKDFNTLCKLDLSEQLTLGEAIDKLRALSHGDFKNAWFEAPEDGKKVFVKIDLSKK